jgi:hypothetical protein
MNGWITACDNNLQSNVLGVLLIEGIMGITIDNEQVKNIINRHIKLDLDIFLCQDDLIKAGFAKYAQL